MNNTDWQWLTRLWPDGHDLVSAHSRTRKRWPPMAGSADALALCAQARGGGLLAVFVAQPADVQRLMDEMNWFEPGLRCHAIPDWETLPYERFSPHPDLISERLRALHALSLGQSDVVLISAGTALSRLPPPSFLSAHTFFLRCEDPLDIGAFRARIVQAGYAGVHHVVAPGEFSVRGSLIDLFPMGAQTPYRIDLLDERIDTIRTFDPDTQRSLEKIKEIRLLPAREFPLDDAARARFRAGFREAFEGEALRSPIYKSVTQGEAPGGIEYFLPLFFEETATLFDYFPGQCTVALHGLVDESLARFWQDTRSRHRMLSGDPEHPILPPERLFLSEEAFFSGLNAFPRYRLSRLENAEPPPGEGVFTREALKAVDPGKEREAPLPDHAYSRLLPPLAVDRRLPDPLLAFRAFADGFDGRICVLAETAGRAQTLRELLEHHGFSPVFCADLKSGLEKDASLMLLVSPLSQGFILTVARLAFVTETELYARTSGLSRQIKARKASNPDGFFRDLCELKLQDRVVHSSHGIGRYRGLVHLNNGEGENEFLHLEYAGGDSLYVPVSQLHLISRYAGPDPDAVSLHRLGSGQWEKACRKAAEKAHDTAAELLDLYARRALREGHRFEVDTDALAGFEEGFGFETTPDQQAAIDAVLEDMQKGHPMDRLVCGDVGFGKTEVALRAAFVAVADGRQVALLCPTTLLAEQHFQTFSDRFALVAAHWPVRLAELSRFKSAREQAKALAEVAQGQIDVVIGTHRLLQKDVRFKRLGLVIIDEEHRFGVRQKEALKNLRSEVDILTLTATPIPRTLGLALEGLRAFSVIATPPQRRLSIKTFLHRFSLGLIREAVLREFKRGGQVFFLHNEVDTIENMRLELTKLLPEARIAVGHGQMPERELERVMRDFTARRTTLLLCTTIIETGIDIPNANTIILNRADRFGLAQLHQLRGRVGRSHHQAYAYLLTDAELKPGSAAQKRLEAICQMEDLGAGFMLAMQDLEIRGAGEILGEHQSGEMADVGFTLYADMLKKAVRRLKNPQGEAADTPFQAVSEINLHRPALLPETYCPDVAERLQLYKRLASCESEGDLNDLQEELIDRFGPCPPQTQCLLETHRLRQHVAPFGVLKLDITPERVTVQFGPQAPIDPAKVIALMQKDRRVRMAGPDRLILSQPLADARARTDAVLRMLSGICNSSLSIDKNPI
jgi:transcription-repair coupling factor (superfamily II helicase)